jgi:hypothetical protein
MRRVLAPLILDSGAIVGETRASPRVRGLLTMAHQAGQMVLVPAGVIAQTVRGGNRDVLIDRLLKRPLVEVSIHDEQRARIAGHLLSRSGSTDAIDALVVAEAVFQGGALIASSDQADLNRLACEYRDVKILAV